MANAVVQSDNSKKKECELETLVTQSRRIYELAVDEEWEKVAELESERQCLIEKCFSSKATFEEPEMAARYIQEIIDLDKKVIAMGVDAQKVLGNALGDLQRGRQATQAYQKVGS